MLIDCKNKKVKNVFRVQFHVAHIGMQCVAQQTLSTLFLQTGMFSRVSVSSDFRLPHERMRIPCD